MSNHTQTLNIQQDSIAHAKRIMTRSYSLAVFRMTITTKNLEGNKEASVSNILFRRVT